MQQQAIRHKVSAGVLALAGAITPVTAQGRPIIVLESYVGQRPAEAEAVMDPLLDELEASGLVARSSSVLQRVGRRAPRPGTLDRHRTAAEIIQPADAGYMAYTRGKFAEAEAVLTLAIARLHRNPALFVLDTNNLDVTFKILVALALSQARRGDTGGSVATMIELIRTFRGRSLTRIDYGPDAEQLYRAVWKQVQTMGRGELTVTVENEQAVVFINGQIRGLRRVALIDVIPGVYRVFIQVPGTAGRQYEVEVNANELAELHVDWELDSSLWMTDSWSGFLFATEAERTRQAAFAGKLARRWGWSIAVVGIVQRRGGPEVTASLYDTTGATVRSAAVAQDGIDEITLRALARFLADGTPTQRVTVIRNIDLGVRVGAGSPSGPTAFQPPRSDGSPGSPDAPAARSAPDSPGARRSPAPPDSRTSPDSPDPASPDSPGAPGSASLGYPGSPSFSDPLASLGSAGIGAVHRPDRPARTLRRSGLGSRLAPGLLIGVGTAAFITGAVLYAVDQDPGPAPPARYLDSAPAGVAIGVAGAATAGTGLWLWRTRSRRASARVVMPVLALTDRGGFFGWAGEL